MIHRMIELASDIRFESSERSASLNWVRGKLQQSGFGLHSFEGYTIKQNRVTLLLDRMLFSGTPEEYTLENLFSKLRNEAGASFDHKVDFANRLGVPWYFLCYMYDPEKAFLIEIRSTICNLVDSFISISHFGKWTMSYRDLTMLSPYEESGLPNIDTILRKNRTPWPGNLDALLSRDGVLIAILEFQNTTKYTVSDHCNNTWFLPRGGRKGDKLRWKVLDLLRLQAKLPLIILVWSPKESTTKFKVVKDIVYSEQAGDRPPGLYYSTKKLIYDFNDLVRELKML